MARLRELEGELKPLAEQQRKIEARAYRWARPILSRALKPLCRQHQPLAAVMKASEFRAGHNVSELTLSNLRDHQVADILVWGVLWWLLLSSAKGGRLRQ